MASWLPAELAASRLQAVMRAKSDSAWYVRARDDAGRVAASQLLAGDGGDSATAAWVAPYVARALAASRLQAAVFYKLARDAYVRNRDEY